MSIEDNSYYQYYDQKTQKSFCHQFYINILKKSYSSHIIYQDNSYYQYSIIKIKNHD